LARPPPSSPVEPSSPDPASSSIFFLRDGTSRLLEDPAQFVKLPGNATRFLDHVGQRHNLDVAITPDRDHPALPRDDQLDGGHPETGRPDPVRRRGRSASLEVPEDRHAGLEAGLALDVAGEQIADSTLGEPDVAEGVLLGLPTGLGLQLWDLRALRDDDDAEQLAFTPAPVEVGDDLPQGDLELWDEDQVSAAGEPP